MTAPLTALVERQLSFTSGLKSSPRRKVRAGPRPLPPLPAPLESGLERALLFYGEGNGWPAREARPAELVHWLAARPATGGRFECLVEPPSGRSPTMLENLDLTEAELCRSVSVEEFRRRWAAFARPDDVACSWGHFPSGLLARSGVAPPPHVDLRTVCNERLRRRCGSLEEAHEALELPPPAPWSPGRGGRRMARLEALFIALTRGRPGRDVTTAAADSV